MKVKFLQLKTFLMAVGLLVGASAWAETYSGTISFNAQNRCTNNNNGTFTTAGNAGNQYALVLADLSGLSNINGATSVTLDFDVIIPSGGRLLVGIGDKNIRNTTAGTSSGSAYDTNGLIMRYGTKDGTYVRVDDGANNSNLLGVSSHVTFTLDRVNKKYSYTITYVDGGSVTQTGFSADNQSTTIDNATVVEAYSWLGNQVITISDISYSYEYSSETFEYTVNAIDNNNNILTELSSGISDDPMTVVYPYAINVNGSWYTTTASSFGVIVNPANPTANVQYVKDEEIVAFYEESDVPGTNILYSNGAYGTVAAQMARNRGITAGTLEPGKYKFIARLIADGNSGRQITIREGANDPLALVVGSNQNKIAESEFYVYATTGQLYINGANVADPNRTNLSTSFDYIIIKKIGELPASVSAEITGAGWATLYTEHDVDFSGVEGLTAYTATYADGTVTLSEVQDVPANTGIVLKGDAKTYDIPVVAASNREKGDLKGSTTEALVYSESAANDYYMLALNDKGNAQFIKLNEGSIAAGKAYLELPKGTETRVLSIIFDGETTGISTVATKAEAAEAIYNLNGQRVQNAVKGLYIVNGKKVVIK